MSKFMLILFVLTNNFVNKIAFDFSLFTFRSKYWLLYTCSFYDNALP